MKTPTKGDMIAWLESERMRLEARLKKGDCFIFLRGSLELSFGHRKIAQVLPPVVEALCSDLSEEKRLGVLERWCVIPCGNRETYRPFVKGFTPSPQLHQRIARIRKEHPYRVPPLTTDELRQLRERAAEMGNTPDERRKALRRLVRAKRRELERQYRPNDNQ
jgi:hypothetical protein